MGMNDGHSFILNKLVDNKGANFSFWKSVKYSKRPIISNFASKKSYGQWVRTESEKADIIVEHLKNTFRPCETEPKHCLDTFGYRYSSNNLEKNQRKNLNYQET